MEAASALIDFAYVCCVLYSYFESWTYYHRKRHEKLRLQTCTVVYWPDGKRIEIRLLFISFESYVAYACLILFTVIFV